MYAILKTGGKQYRVSKGQTIKVELLDAEPGGQIELGDILLVADGSDVKVGAPFLSGAKVTADVIQHGRGKKIEVIKFKRRKNYMRTQGHRQGFTEIKITDITSG